MASHLPFAVGSPRDAGESAPYNSPPPRSMERRGGCGTAPLLPERQPGMAGERSDHHHAGDECDIGRLLADRQPHPKRPEYRLDKVEEPDLGGRKVARA